jgi:hypothetical protein
MARTRSIKPEFWSDEKLASISRDARLTFIGLWTASDDYGVVKGHPVWLKAQVFPYDEITTGTFQRWITELETVGVIVPFTHHKEKYYFIKSFQTHQKISHPSPAKNPTVPESIRNGSGKIPVETETETETSTAFSDCIPEGNQKILFDFKTGEFLNLNGKAEFWQKAYPAINVLSEIKKAAAWLIANPKNKKSDYPRFLNAWLSRAQDRAPKVANNDGPFKSTYS